MSRAALHNVEAERSLIGAILASPGALADHADVTEADFVAGPHRAIWSAILAVSKRMPDLDPYAVAAELNARGELNPDVRKALREAEVMVPSSVLAPHYAGLVAEAATRRKLIAACDELRERALDPDAATNDLLAEADRVLSALGERAAGDDPTQLGIAMTEALQQIDAERKGAVPEKAPSGLPTLDKFMGGVGKGELFVLAARPGVGKSSLAFQWAIHSARQGRGAYVCALEMRGSELARRWIASSAAVPQSSLKSLRLSQLQMSRMGAAVAESDSLPIWLADASRQSIADIRAQVRRWKRRRPELALVVVDYLQLVTAGLGRGANREQEVSAVARGLKQLAREADVGVLALSQLNRDQEKAGRPPVLSDLRESGEIEQAADAVLFIHKGKDATPGNDEAQSVACELIVAKQRNGQSQCIAPAWFRSAWTTFEERAPEWR